LGSAFIGRGEAVGIEVKEIMAKMVHFVPETKPLRELFNEFQKLKIHMAVAIDEHGGTAGLITTEDMLEEIVGEIADEHDTVQPIIEHQADGSYVIEGKLGLYELEELFDIEIEDHDYDTVGGLIFARLGRIPTEGEIVEDLALRFQVLEVDGKRIAKIRVGWIGDKGKWGDGE
jgi:CBS domain containing-hemolysin-like protein